MYRQKKTNHRKWQRKYRMREFYEREIVVERFEHVAKIGN